MTLYDCVRDNIDLIKEGIADLAFYKIGRSWHVQEFWELNYPEDFDTNQVADINMILKNDPNAIIFNGYLDCPFTEDLTLKELTNVVRRFYDKQLNPLEDALGACLAYNELIEVND